MRIEEAAAVEGHKDWSPVERPGSSEGRDRLVQPGQGLQEVAPYRERGRLHHRPWEVARTVPLLPLPCPLGRGIGERGCNFFAHNTVQPGAHLGSIALMFHDFTHVSIGCFVLEQFSY